MDYYGGLMDRLARIISTLSPYSMDEIMEALGRMSSTWSPYSMDSYGDYYMGYDMWYYMHYYDDHYYYDPHTQNQRKTPSAKNTTITCV